MLHPYILILLIKNDGYKVKFIFLTMLLNT
jgi:hypothetical protein